MMPDSGIIWWVSPSIDKACLSQFLFDSTHYLPVFEIAYKL